MCQEMCKNGSCPMGAKHATVKSAGLLALRIAVAIIFIYAGWMKLTTYHGTAAQGMAMVGIPGNPSAWAYIVGGLEVLGGAMVLLGIYATYATLPLIIIMIVAIFRAHPAGSTFSAYFTELSLLGGLLAILGSGAGCYRLIKSQCCCKTCKGTTMEIKQESGCCGGGGCGKKMMGQESCSCKSCCNSRCACGTPNGNCKCCAK